MDQYPDLITDEDLSFFSSAPGRGAMQNASTGNDRPWPGSIQDLAENSEPQATPA
jgi:hypothetical protein